MVRLIIYPSNRYGVTSKYDDRITRDHIWKWVRRRKGNVSLLIKYANHLWIVTNLLRGVYDLLFSVIFANCQGQRITGALSPGSNRPFIFEAELTDEDYFFDIDHATWTTAWMGSEYQWNGSKIHYAVGIHYSENPWRDPRNSNMRKRLSWQEPVNMIYQEAISNLQTHQPGQPTGFSNTK